MPTSKLDANVQSDCPVGRQQFWSETSSSTLSKMPRPHNPANLADPFEHLGLGKTRFNIMLHDNVKNMTIALDKSNIAVHGTYISVGCGYCLSDALLTTARRTVQHIKQKTAASYYDKMEQYILNAAVAGGVEVICRMTQAASCTQHTLGGLIENILSVLDPYGELRKEIENTRRSHSSHRCAVGRRADTDC